MTKEELLQEFPDYKPTCFSSALQADFIIPVFTYWDKVELEERYLEKYNRENPQMLLFL